MVNKNLSKSRKYTEHHGHIRKYPNKKIFREELKDLGVDLEKMAKEAQTEGKEPKKPIEDMLK